MVTNIGGIAVPFIALSPVSLYDYKIIILINFSYVLMFVSYYKLKTNKMFIIKQYHHRHRLEYHISKLYFEIYSLKFSAKRKF